MSNLERTYGARGRVGAQGESYWARALERAGLTKFEVFYSLSIPEVPGRPSIRGDIDCAVANGNAVVLIDVKRWAGSFFWTLPGTNKPMNGFKPHTKNGEWRLSQTMITALDRMRQRLPEADVSAMVVFVPTRNHDRESVPFEVAFLKWPGGIKSYLAADGATELKRRLGNEVEEVQPRIMHLLSRLKRNG